MVVSEGDSGVCLVELIAALSLGTDLGLGHPMEHVLRQCLLALGLGERFELDGSERSVVYYVALLAWVGCHADSHEQARWFGDDIAARTDVYATDMTARGRRASTRRSASRAVPPRVCSRPSTDCSRFGEAASGRPPGDVAHHKPYSPPAASAR